MSVRSWHSRVAQLAASPEIQDRVVSHISQRWLLSLWREVSVLSVVSGSQPAYQIHRKFPTFQMPLCALIGRSIDPQPTSGRLSCPLTATAAESHEDDEYVNRFRSRNILRRVDFADNDSRSESECERKLLCRSAQPDRHLHIHIQPVEQSHSRHGTDFSATSSVHQAAAVHRTATAAAKARQCDEANVDSRGALAGVQSNQLGHRVDEFFDDLSCTQSRHACTTQSSSKAFFSRHSRA